jgi:hypothetical protein
MTGDKELFEMRRSGLKPEFVWVSDSTFSMLDGFTVRLAGDTPELLDLRFLVGVTALTQGSDSARLTRISEACMAAKARRVIATLSDPISHEVIQITDTQGAMTWQI